MLDGFRWPAGGKSKRAWNTTVLSLLKDDEYKEQLREKGQGSDKHTKLPDSACLSESSTPWAREIVWLDRGTGGASGSGDGSKGGAGAGSAANE